MTGRGGSRWVTWIGAGLAAIPIWLAITAFGLTLGIIGAALALGSGLFRAWLVSRVGWRARLGRLPGLGASNRLGLALAMLVWGFGLNLVALLLLLTVAKDIREATGFELPGPIAGLGLAVLGLVVLIRWGVLGRRHAEADDEAPPTFAQVLGRPLAILALIVAAPAVLFVVTLGLVTVTTVGERPKPTVVAESAGLTVATEPTRSTRATAAPSAQPTTLPTPVPIRAADPTPTTRPESPPTSTPRPAPPTATIPPGSRQAPLPFGQTYRFRKGLFGDQEYTVEVREVLRGAAARDFLKRAKGYATTPLTGHDYILVQLRLVYLRGSETRPMRVTSGEHRLYVVNRFWGDPVLSPPPEPALEHQDIFPGVTLDGWLAAKSVPVEYLDEAALVYDDVYFALR